MIFLHELVCQRHQMGQSSESALGQKVSGMDLSSGRERMCFHQCAFCAAPSPSPVHPVIGLPGNLRCVPGLAMATE